MNTLSNNFGTKHKFKICIVCSIGGHLTQVLQLEEIYRKYDYFFVIDENRKIPATISKSTYLVTPFERDWRFFITFYEAFRIMKKERPNLILSTGAGVVVPFALLAKIFKCKVIFIETFAAVYRPSLAGRIMYNLANKFFYQWRYLEKFYPRGCYGGSIF